MDGAKGAFGSTESRAQVLDGRGGLRCECGEAQRGMRHNSLRIGDLTPCTWGKTAVEMRPWTTSRRFREADLAECACHRVCRR